MLINIDSQQMEGLGPRGVWWLVAGGQRVVVVHSSHQLGLDARGQPATHSCCCGCLPRPRPLTLLLPLPAGGGLEAVARVPSVPPGGRGIPTLSFGNLKPQEQGGQSWGWAGGTAAFPRRMGSNRGLTAPHVPYPGQGASPASSSCSAFPANTPKVTIGGTQESRGPTEVVLLHPLVSRGPQAQPLLCKTGVTPAPLQGSCIMGKKHH